MYFIIDIDEHNCTIMSTDSHRARCCADFIPFPFGLRVCRELLVAMVFFLISLFLKIKILWITSTEFIISNSFASCLIE